MDLPKIEVPDLKQTLERYLASLQPVIPCAQYEQTKKTVEEFLKPDKEGEKLQKLLKQFAETSENWVSFVSPLSPQTFERQIRVLIAKCDRSQCVY
ncbi:hypothetical protein B4U79_09786 [Dinothrombium tinctorium]|uniref:Choline/carnitine acyltransferase domain-containing protein n=1 Tax=Dinothrombium tinctorium TaxID=1965070 RepID=A0A443R2A0_9ACAR|nr:hypothetical protein B4U79_09786 [Dinothrombium tinctorium]